MNSADRDIWTRVLDLERQINKLNEELHDPEITANWAAFNRVPMVETPNFSMMGYFGSKLRLPHIQTIVDEVADLAARIPSAPRGVIFLRLKKNYFQTTMVWK